MTVSIVVPVKRLTEGKSRLTSALTAAARRDLCVWMLVRTLRTLSRLQNVVVVSDDPQAGEIASTFDNVRFLFDRGSRELNGAVSTARDVIAGGALMIVPTDLVWLDLGVLTTFLKIRGTIHLAGDLANDGTNLLFLPERAARDFAFSFGPGSLIRHSAEARRLGFSSRIFRSRATAADLDNPADLSAARAIIPASIFSQSTPLRKGVEAIYVE